MAIVGFYIVDVSENSGNPKSSILIGFSIINHPFWGTTIFGKHPYWISGVYHQTSAPAGGKFPPGLQDSNADFIRLADKYVEVPPGKNVPWFGTWEETGRSTLKLWGSNLERCGERYIFGEIHVRCNICHMLIVVMIFLRLSMKCLTRTAIKTLYKYIIVQLSNWPNLTDAVSQQRSNWHPCRFFWKIPPEPFFWSWNKQRHILKKKHGALLGG